MQATFRTSSQHVEICCYALNTTDTIMFRVNGRWVHETMPLRTGFVGNSYMTTLTFPSVAHREITMVCSQNVGLAKIRVDQGQGVLKPPASRRTVAIIGDSYVNGSGSYTSNSGAMQLETFALRAAHLMGAEDVILAGIGGTGWVAGLDGATPNPYGTRLDAVLAMNPHVIVFYGSVNDGPSGSAAVLSAVRDCLARCSGVPEVYVAGPVLTGWSVTNGAIRATVAEAGRQFVDIGSVIYGSGKTGSTTGDGNADQLLLSDGIHPTFAGHQLLASKFYRSYAAL